MRLSTAGNLQPPPDYLALNDALRERNGRTLASYRHLEIDSAYQPIFSLTHRRAVGHEALLRATHDGQRVSPLEALDLAAREGEIVHLDRLCRALHIANFDATRDRTGWLFLNVNPKVSGEGRAHGSLFARMLEAFDFPPHRVVIEIVEEAIEDEAVLEKTVAYYRELGCMVAVDDFGAGHSNFERIWRLSPDIVKLDRSIISQAARSPKVRNILPSMVSLIHDAGGLALVEGVETDEEALIAMDVNVDLVQGYYFGRPAELPAPPLAPEAFFPELYGAAMALAEETREKRRRELTPYITVTQHCAASLEAGVPLESAGFRLANKPRVTRLYLLDHQGTQVDSITACGRDPVRLDPRFAPLQETSGAIWRRMPYFCDAIHHPGEVQISRPYLSQASARMTLTLSTAFELDGARRVFCCDLDWSD